MFTTTQARRQTAMALDPHHDEKARFAAHWVRDSVTRSSKTFGGRLDPIHDDVEPNHDGVVRIFDPNKPAGAMPGLRSRKTSKPKPTFQITVTFGGKL